MKKIHYIFIFAFILISKSSFASPVKWYFDDLHFVGGITITGSFIYDANTNVFSDIDVVASAEPFNNVQYWEISPDSSSNFINLYSFSQKPGWLGTTILEEYYFYGLLAEPMTDVGTYIDFLNTSSLVYGSSVCTFRSCSGGITGYPIVNGGIRTKNALVPLPSAIWMFGGGLIGILFKRSSRKG